MNYLPFWCRSACIVGVFLLLPLLLWGQPLPCGPVPDMTPTCDEACVICDIDGFTGVNDDTEQGFAPPGFCTGVVHHMQWIAFVAGSSDLTMEVTPFNCNVGSGLEVGIYESIDCVNYAAVSDCDGEILDGETGVFSNIVPLVVGQYYYFVMDGNQGDVCNYTINVTEGSTTSPPVTGALLLEGDMLACAGTPANYSFEADGATHFEWVVDGVPYQNGLDTSSQVSVLWASIGEHEVCVTAMNVCDTAAQGCAFVTVNAPSTNSIVVDICDGNCLEIGTQSYCTTGIFDQVLTNIVGCDSLVHIDLSVYPTPVVNQIFNICQGQSVVVGSSSYSATGTYTDILLTTHGCDSTININLTVHDLPIVSQTLSICNGQNVTVGNSVYTSTGDYTDVLISSHGCDSTVLTNLTVNEAISYEQSVAICFGDSVNVGSNIHSTEGTFVDVLQTQEGCDSTVTTHLEVNQNLFTGQNIAICQGDTLSVGNNTHTTAGLFIDVLQSQNGCDSIVTTTLTVWPTEITFQNLTRCQGESVSVGTNIYTTTGSHVDILLTEHGCDSTINTNLTVNPAYDITQNIAFCQGQSINIGNNTYATSGDFTDNLQTFSDCDSVIHTNLTVWPVYDINQSFSICNNQSVNIGNNTYNTTGIYFDALQTIYGCDSLITTVLVVNPTQIMNQAFTICVTESVTVGSNTYNTTGNYTDLLQNQFGCDSIVNTFLTVVPYWTTNQNISICAGDSLVIGSNIYKISGTYLDTISTWSGCDSFVTTNLTVFLSTDQFQQFNICQGESVVVGNHIYINSGTYIDYLTDPNGCPKVITTSLVVIPVHYASLSIDDLAICLGDSVALTINIPDDGHTTVNMTVLPDNIQLSLYNTTTLWSTPTNTTNYSLSNVTVTGNPCPVLTSLPITVTVSNLDIQAQATTDYHGYEVSCADGQNGAILVSAYGTPPYSYAWSSQNAGAYNSHLEAGTYYITATDQAGCTDTDSVTLTAPPDISLEYYPTLPTCSYSNDGQISVTNIGGGVGGYSILINGETYSYSDTDTTDIPYLVADTYTLTVVDANQCQHNFEATLPAPPDQVISLGPDTILQFGDELLLQAYTNFLIDSILWTPADWLDRTDTTVAVTRPPQDMLYTVVATDSIGCIATDQIYINIIRNDGVFAPNIITPNDDGINDYFTIYANPNQVERIQTLRIFDRWGTLLFEAADIPPSIEQLGYNGKFRGQTLNAAVLVWYAELRFFDQTTQFYKGEFTILP